MLLMDSMDFPSMGLIILCGIETKETLQTGGTKTNGRDAVSTFERIKDKIKLYSLWQ